MSRTRFLLFFVLSALAAGQSVRPPAHIRKTGTFRSEPGTFFMFGDYIATQASEAEGWDTQTWVHLGHSWKKTAHPVPKEIKPLMVGACDPLDQVDLAPQIPTDIATAVARKGHVKVKEYFQIGSTDQEGSIVIYSRPGAEFQSKLEMAFLQSDAPQGHPAIKSTVMIDDAGYFCVADETIAKDGNPAEVTVVFLEVAGSGVNYYLETFEVK